METTNKMENKKGTSYAFFNCDATKQEIEKEMPKIRDFAQTPGELELLLHENTGKLQLDTKLKQIVSTPRDSRILRSGVGVDSPEVVPLEDLKYVLEAKYSGATNEETASELGDVMNYLSYSDVNNLSFNGKIAYEKDGEYLFRESD